MSEANYDNIWLLIINPDETPTGRVGVRNYDSPEQAMRDRDRLNIQGPHAIISWGHLMGLVDIMNEVAAEPATS